MKLNVNCTKHNFHQLWLPEASIWRCEDPASQWLQRRKLNQNFPHTDQFKVTTFISTTLSFTESSRNSCQTRAKFDFTLQRHRTVMKLNWKRGQFSWKVSLHYISRSRKTQWRRNWGLWTEPKQNITKFKNSNALFKRQLHNAFLLELKSKSIYLPWNYFQMISCFFGCLALINKGPCAGVFPKKRHSSIIWIYLRQLNI